MPPSAITFTPCSRHTLGDVADRGELRHAHAGNHPRGADRSRADPHFHGVGSGGDQIARALLGHHVAGHHRHFGKRAEFADHVHHAAGVTGGGIDEQRVGPGVDQRLAAVDAIGPHAHGGAAAELAIVVLGGGGESDAFFDIRAGDQARQTAVRMNQRQFLDPVLIEDAAGLLQAGGGRRGDEFFPAASSRRPPWHPAAPDSGRRAR